MSANWRGGSACPARCSTCTCGGWRRPASWAAVIMTWSTSGRSRKSDSDQLHAALDASTAADAKVAEQLAALDKRLAAIEKTLTDIG